MDQDPRFGRLEGGSQPLAAAVPATNSAQPVTWTNLLLWTASEPHDCDLQITVPNNDGVIGFPPGVVGFQAGARADVNDGLGMQSWNAVPSVVMRIECGGGPDARTVYADLRSGRYSIGPQTRVKVDFASYLALDPASSAKTVQGSIVPRGSSGDFLTYSATRVLTGAALSAFSLPLVPGAMWFEIYADKDIAATLGTTGSGTGLQIVRGYNTANNIGFFPPFSPIPCAGGVSLSVLKLEAADTTATVVYWIR